jgi:uncharacterized secreted protein with C-terminal beta-propeller domain
VGHPAIVERLEERLVLTASLGQLSAVPALALPGQFTSQQEFDQALIDTQVAQWSWALGQTFPTVTSPPKGINFAFTASAQSNTVSSMAGPTTNVGQPDLVKTDGKYLYLVQNGFLDIINVQNPKAMSVVWQTTFDGSAVAEFLNGTRLTVIRGTDPTGVTFHGPVVGPGGLMAHPDISWLVFSQTVVTEFDVSNPASPSVIRTTTLDGTYADSVQVGNQVDVTVNANLGALPSPTFTENGDAFTYETEAQYRAQLGTAVAGLAFPQFHSTVNGSTGSTNASGPLVAIDSIYKPQFPKDEGLVVIASFDATSQAAGPTSTVGVMDAAGGAPLYATQNHLYFASDEIPDMVANTADPSHATNSMAVIREFTLNGDTVTMTAIGVIPGEIYFPGALSELGGSLRVVTDSSIWNGGMASEKTNLYVLKAENGALNVVGSVENLAPGQMVRQVQFSGTEAFVLDSTGGPTGSLLTFDLSDPSNPKAAGSVQFTNDTGTFQVLDSTHIVTVGWAVPAPITSPIGVQITLFDVSDLTNPKAVGTTTIAPPGWTTIGSIASYYAPSISYYADKQILALPVFGYTPTNNLTPGGSINHVSGLPPGFHSQMEVFKVDPTTGLTALGEVPFDTQATRSVEIGDTLFSISQDEVKANDILDPSTELSHVTVFTTNEAGGEGSGVSGGGGGGSRGGGGGGAGSDDRGSGSAGSGSQPGSGAPSNPGSKPTPVSPPPDLWSLFNIVKRPRSAHTRLPGRKVVHPSPATSHSIRSGKSHHGVTALHPSLHRLANRRLH